MVAFAATVEHVERSGVLLFMPSKLGEREAILLVQSGELSITENGEVWRLRRRYSSTVSVPCNRRAEHCANGYLYFQVRSESRRIMVMAHRLVWQYFHGDIPDGMEINHKNGIKHDNRPCNLEIVTPHENLIHASRVIKTKCGRGEKNSLHKLTDVAVLEIRKRREAGEKLTVMAKEFCVSESLLSMLCSRRIWTHI